MRIMIKLTKNNKPQILEDHAEKWTEQLIQLVNAGEEVPTSLQKKYNHSDVKEILKLECFGKCMYCESKIAHIAYEHIEHIKPKSTYPEQTFSWKNLGLACPVCNNNKRNVFDEECPFVNPYEDEPAEFFIFVGPLVYHLAGNIRAELTEKTIKLNRHELLECRKDRIDAVRELVDRFRSETNSALKRILRNQIEKEIEDDKAYSACTRSVVNALMQDGEH